jgi:hypothetical protein
LDGLPSKGFAGYLNIAGKLYTIVTSSSAASAGRTASVLLELIILLKSGHCVPVLLEG